MNPVVRPDKKRPTGSLVPDMSDVLVRALRATSLTGEAAGDQQS